MDSYNWHNFEIYVGKRSSRWGGQKNRGWGQNKAHLWDLEFNTEERIVKP
jgi:hypothetical protein